MKFNVRKIQTLARDGESLVSGRIIEVEHDHHEVITFAVTRDLQIWHCSYWVEGGFREWFKEWRQRCKAHR